MGLTIRSTGKGAADTELIIRKPSPDAKVAALAGNPNVGKSTVFNNLTGMNQHTGNWPGKTVTNAQGFCSTDKYSYVLVDIPGTYSLMAHSAEEEIARNFICFGGADEIIVVCDATCLERNLNLVLQTIEICDEVIVCVNLMDEAKRKHIAIDIKKLEHILGVSVVGAVAREKKSLDGLLLRMDEMADAQADSRQPVKVHYPEEIEQAAELVLPAVKEILERNGRKRPAAKWLALKLLEGDTSLLEELNKATGTDICKEPAVSGALNEARRLLESRGVDPNTLKDKIVSTVVKQAEDIGRAVVQSKEQGYRGLDKKLDRILTSRRTGYPVMIALLAVILWLTITGANYPSQLLSQGLFWVQDKLMELFVHIGAPQWLTDMLIEGVYRVLAWVVSVMLPPMAIFFPLFTLLEDAGYLPRVAYNLDKPFKRCCACGKQALSMCMGFGCNAAGIVGCRIIDSPRERLIAMLTNNFVPCNGRFPTLIALITMFFIGTKSAAGSSVIAALMLTAAIVLGVVMTFVVSGILSRTLLKGVPSSFTLELPPYRRPQIGKVIVRSIFDRTLFVLGRAVVVAAPAGLVIWFLANVDAGGVSLLAHLSDFLDPFARLLGLDGVILLAFILGFPANEIVVPIMIMAYTAQGSLLELDSLSEMHRLFVDNGWTWVTAVCTMLFSLMHWPCSTTLLTIRKETGGLKWTAAAFLIPTVTGMLLCFLVSRAALLLG
ncbi:ferrous iron transport protein B [[Clostridium] hylemonae]|uniref:ferrous iron transport protein B n=1 Tax=[Clostridium] hylemonae TaxID=89153 RepID=UPI001106D1FB|nr:ferrous iron transport protein B [[Clostridium] hylemonae]